MRHLALTVPQVVFIAATRGALGVGVGLMLSDRIPEPRRRTLALSLLAFGALTTIPAARTLLGAPTVAGPRALVR